MKPTVAGLCIHITSDLDRIEDELRWAHADGYWPTNAAPSHGPASPTPDDRIGDHISGARHDIGIGNHRRRQAIARAVVALRIAETHLATAAGIAGGWWPRVLFRGPSTCERALRSIEVARLRVEFIRSRPQRHDVIRSPLAAAARATASAAAILQAAWVDRDDDGTQAPVELGPACRICRIRPAAPKDQRTGGRCATCKRFRDRHGFERPRTEDSDGIAGARAAQQRRRARGEGWGEA